MITAKLLGFTVNLTIVSYGDYRRVNLAYTVVTPTNVVFSGSEFSPSPLFEPTSPECAIDLLSWICLRYGDTDEEYFKDYTPEQSAWARSPQCEEIAATVNDFISEHETQYPSAPNEDGFFLWVLSAPQIDGDYDPNYSIDVLMKYEEVTPAPAPQRVNYLRPHDLGSFYHD